MSGYLGHRLLLAIPTLFFVLLVTFLMVRLAPGDPVDAYLSETRATEEQYARLRRRLGLDRPLPVQFAFYVGRAIRGDLGWSYFTREPVLATIAARLPFTLMLAVTAEAFSIAVGVPLGILAAVRRGSWIDRATTAAAVTLYSLPRFWVGLLLLLAFAVWLPWLPITGAGSAATPAAHARYLVLPVLAIGLAHASLLARVTRAAVLEVLREDFVRTARGKGLAEAGVLSRHVLRNVLIPLVTVAGLGFGRLLSGSVVIETIFVRPGLGTLLVEAMRARDYPIVQGTILVFAAGIVLINIAVDALYAAANPRVRLR